MQENGVEFDAFIRGDEWNNWYETMDGYSIAKNSQNVWKYVIDVDGVQFKLSNRDAHLPPITINVEKHLQPVPNIIPPNHAEENPIDLFQMTREEFEIPLVLIDYPNKTMTINNNTYNEGDWLSLNGSQGNVYGNKLPLIINNMNTLYTIYKKR